jgi:hypothetical protein
MEGIMICITTILLEGIMQNIEVKSSMAQTKTSNFMKTILVG